MRFVLFFLVLYEVVAELGRLPTVGGESKRGVEDLTELRAELALVAGFLSAEKVGDTVRAIELKGLTTVGGESVQTSTM